MRPDRPGPGPRPVASGGVLSCGAVAGQRDAIGFAEKVLELLDEGRYTATYKYAVLMALIDLCLEGTQRSGAPPEMVTTRQLADKIVEIYWPHTMPFASRAQPVRPAPEHGRTGRDRIGHLQIPIPPPAGCERHTLAGRRWRRDGLRPSGQAGRVELIEMPLPRLQMMRDSRTTASSMKSSGRTGPAKVRGPLRGWWHRRLDNRVLLRPAWGLSSCSSTACRLLIQRRWARMVAQLNRLDDSRLEAFLFGADRLTRAGEDPSGPLGDSGAPLLLLRWTARRSDAQPRRSLPAVVALPGRQPRQPRCRGRHCYGFKSNSLALPVTWSAGPAASWPSRPTSAALRAWPSRQRGSASRTRPPAWRAGLSPPSGRCPALAAPAGSLVDADEALLARSLVPDRV